jgi:hypothetical protein
MAYITYRDTLRRMPAGESLLQHDRMPAAHGDIALRRSVLAPLQAVVETALVVATLGFFTLMVDSTIAGVF